MRLGPKAERFIARTYGLERPPTSHAGAGSWADLWNPRTRTPYQVKAASTRLRGPPRVRLWEDQHRALTASQGQGHAWYAFVLMDRRGRVQAHTRCAPTTVTTIVRELGGWNVGGHRGRRGHRQLKIPIQRVLR